MSRSQDCEFVKFVRWNGLKTIPNYEWMSRRDDVTIVKQKWWKNTRKAFFKKWVSEIILICFRDLGSAERNLNKEQGIFKVRRSIDRYLIKIVGGI